MKEYVINTAFILACCVVFILGVPIMGLVVSQSWNWFLAPIAGLRAISITEGIGLSMFLAMVGTIITLPLRKWENEYKPDDSPNMILVQGVSKMAGLFVVSPLAGLAGAWVWHTFVISPP